jgi:glycosyltransferase involved in cell wall biosynthesis
METRYVSSVPTKHLEAITHTTLAAIRTLRGFDIVHFHAVGPGLLSPLPRYLSRARVVQTVHGLDRERDKWGAFPRMMLTVGERMSARLPDATITVSQSLSSYFKTRYGKETEMIPNGVTPGTARAPGALSARLGVARRRYVLFVGRLVPEKAPDLLIKAFAGVAGDVRLVVVGGTSYSDEYVAHLTELASRDPRVILPGYLYGAELEELYTNAALFVSPSTLEAGNPITMLEAISFGVPIVVSDIPEHLEGLPGDAPGSRIFSARDEGSLTAALERSLAELDLAFERAAALRATILATHDWDAAASRTADVYERIAP